MMIRLAITAGTGAPTTFEHSGPTIRIGRDPACELALQGASGEAASRHHARIELGAGRATLTDAGSRNGTLLNGGLLNGPIPLRVGDQIRMGFTGALLTVLALDLSPTRPGKARPLRRPLLIGVVAAALVVAVTGTVVLPRLAAGKVRTAIPQAGATRVRVESSRSDAASPPPVPDEDHSGKPEQQPGDPDDVPIAPPPVPEEKPPSEPLNRPRLVTPR